VTRLESDGISKHRKPSKYASTQNENHLDRQLKVVYRQHRISRPTRRIVIFSLGILEKRKNNNDEYIVSVVIYWKKTGLLRTKISNHNIIYSS
jgi:hypothetical protein